ncbi:MAG: glycosyltransferase [Promethearchaeota archaeon]|jgi:glycosyltransferase involved in cell wall biosynthesis
MNTIGIFSKLGMPGGSENRVTQLANAFCRRMPTYIFAEKEFSKKLKSQLDERVILREHTTEVKRHRYELQGVDRLLVVNSDSYSFCKSSYWDGTQGKHHKHHIDINETPLITFLFNYVVGPSQWLVDLHKKNPRIRILCTSQWFIDNIRTEKKFRGLRELDLPIETINSPVSAAYDLEKAESSVIRINRHSMGFAYKHDQDNLRIVDELCRKYKDKISFKWMGVPDKVRNTSSKDKNDKVPYREVLRKHKQVDILPDYSVPVPEFLQETDILFFDISRFRKEPWPRTIAEGMMAGCCCVTNNNHGMVEQIENEKTGYLFDNADQAIEQLSYLIENPAKIKEVGENARCHAKTYFLDDVIVDKMLTFMMC